MLIVRNPRSFDAFDRVFDDLTSRWSAPAASRRLEAPTVDAEWRDGSLVLTVDLPGIPKEALTVSVADRAVTVAVEHSTERGTLQWSRGVQLGGSLDPEQVSARYVDGRLTIIVPPAAKPAARTVAIESAPDVVVEPAPAIEASAEG